MFTNIFCRFPGNFSEKTTFEEFVEIWEQTSLKHVSSLCVHQTGEQSCQKYYLEKICPFHQFPLKCVLLQANPMLKTINLICIPPLLLLLYNFKSNLTWCFPVVLRIRSKASTVLLGTKVLLTHFFSSPLRMLRYLREGWNIFESNLMRSDLDYLFTDVIFKLSNLGNKT